MPFDSLPSSLDPNLPSLVAALRNIPAGFRWDYRCSKSCAMGLAAMLWPERAPNGANPWEHWGRVLGLSEAAADMAFGFAGLEKNKRAWDVTPDDVADVLEAQIT